MLSFQMQPSTSSLNTNLSKSTANQLLLHRTLFESNKANAQSGDENEHESAAAGAGAGKSDSEALDSLERHIESVFRKKFHKVQRHLTLMFDASKSTHEVLMSKLMFKLLMAKFKILMSDAQVEQVWQRRFATHANAHAPDPVSFALICKRFFSSQPKQSSSVSNADEATTSRSYRQMRDDVAMWRHHVETTTTDNETVDVNALLKRIRGRVEAKWSELKRSFQEAADADADADVTFASACEIFKRHEIALSQPQALALCTRFCAAAAAAASGSDNQFEYLRFLAHFRADAADHATTTTSNVGDKKTNKTKNFAEVSVVFSHFLIYSSSKFTIQGVH